MSTLVMTTRSLKIFLEWQNGRKNKNSAFHHFHVDRNAPCFPPTPLPHQKKTTYGTTIVLLSLIVLDFSWDDCNTQEKLQTMIMQSLGGGEGLGLGHRYSNIKSLLAD